MKNIANIKTAICIPVRQEEISKSYAFNWPKDIDINIFISNKNNIVNSNVPTNFKIHACDCIEDTGILKNEIINWCILENIDYCILLNEDVKTFSVYGYNIQNSIIELTHLMCALPAKCIGIVPYKTANIYNNCEYPLKINNCNPFLAFTPTQAIFLDINKCKENDLNFESNASVGISYSAFYSDILTAGLCLYTSIDITYIADDEYLLDIKLSHSRKRDLESKFLSRALRCKKYVNKLTFGVYLIKQYSKFYNFYITELVFDNEYFYKILVKDRIYNTQVINQFIKYDN